MNQLAIVVRPTFGGDTGLNTTELDQKLSEGWQVVSTEASTNGAILVIIQKDQSPPAPAAQ